LIFLLILYFSFIFQGTNIIFGQNNEKSNRNIEINLSTSNSHEYDWYITWGGGSSDNGGRVAVDSSDNVYVAGYTESYGAGGADIVLVKFDNSGTYQWQCIWGGVNYDYGIDVAVDSTDNIYLVGSTQSFTAGGSDLVLVKYNSAGVQQWNRTWGGTEDDEGLGVNVDSSNNVYITGYTESFGNVLLAKYDSSGVEQWVNTESEIGSLGRALVLDSLGNIYVAGDTYYGAGHTDICLEKYNSAGVLLWNKTWGGSNWDHGWGVVVDSSDNVYVSGKTRSFGAGDSDMVLLKYDNTGVQQWYRTWGGISTDSGNRIAVDSLNNVYLAGTTVGFGGGLFDMTLVKYNFLGEEQWYYTWGGVSNEFGTGIVLDSSENVYVGGITEFSLGNIAIVKYCKIPEIIINSPQENELFGSIAPNFNISIHEPNLDSTFYTLDDGITNIPFSGLTGIINQMEWDKEPSGEVTIQFYANNTLGKEGYTELTVFKDIENPEITINNPIQGDKIGDDTPNYDISILEPNLEAIWYTIDGGITNYTIYQDFGNINQAAWDEALYGYITIRFYAKDRVGNIGYSEVVVEKVERGENEIPCELRILISVISGGAVIGVASLLLIRRKRK